MYMLRVMDTQFPYIRNVSRFPVSYHQQLNLNAGKLLKSQSCRKWAVGLKINDSEKMDHRGPYAPTPGQYTCILP